MYNATTRSTRRTSSGKGKEGQGGGKMRNVGLSEERLVVKENDANLEKEGRDDGGRNR